MKKSPLQERKLGRGLSALMGESRENKMEKITRPSSRSGDSVESIAINKIIAGIYQPRKTFSSEEINELAISIKESGLIQPIILRRTDEEDGYEIIAGERRFRASQVAGFDTIPAIVKKINNHEALELAIVENVQRSDLTLTEEAVGYQRLIDEFSYTQEHVSKRIGKSRSHVTNLLRLLTLPTSVQNLLNEKLISMGHARAIINSNNPEELAKKVIEESLSVRNIEDLVRDEKIEKVQNSKSATKTNLVNSKQLTQIESELSEALGTDVKISYNSFKRNGKITIKFSDIEDVQNLVKNIKN